MSHWICPKCQAPLEQNDKVLRCIDNHSYDRARQGYWNLLLANQKKSRTPGDSEEMIQARSQFLRAGYYQPLVTAICELVAAQFAGRDRVSILDLGCGEGFYLESLAAWLVDRGQSLSALGLDISKSAVRLAAAKAKQRGAGDDQLVFDYAVASSFRPPVLPASIDLLLNIFAPFEEGSACQLLAPGGGIVRVYPAENHLQEIRQRLYREVRAHQKIMVVPGLELIDEQRVSFAVTLGTPEAVTQLLTMTPLAWHGDREQKALLQQENQLVVTADFYLQYLVPECSVNPQAEHQNAQP